MRLRVVNRHKLGDAYLFESDGRPLEAYFSGDYVQPRDELRAQRYGKPGAIALEEKAIVKVSCMAGCPYRCLPCDAGLAGYGGCLSAQQMSQQFRFVVQDQRLERCAKLKLHLSKLGEPALNWRACSEFLRATVADYPQYQIVPTVSTLPRAPRLLERMCQDLFGWDHPLKQLKINLGATDEQARREMFGRVLPLPRLAAILSEQLINAQGQQRITLTLLAMPEQEVDPQALIDAVPRVLRPRFTVEMYKLNQTEHVRAHSLRSGLVSYRDSERYQTAFDRLEDAGFRTYFSAPSNAEQTALIANGSSLLLRESGPKATGGACSLAP